MKFTDGNIFRSAIAALLACIFSYGTLSALGAGLTSLVSGFDDTYYLKCFYDLFNKGTRAMPESDAIRVIDIGDYNSRSEIAEVIGKVSACNPAVIGLDVFMAENAELKHEADAKVLEAFSSVGCTVVSPCVFDENTQTWMYPFYKDSLVCGNVMYASPVAFDMLDRYDTTDPRSSMKTIASCIAEKYSEVVGLKLNDFEGMALNYRNKEFFTVERIEDIDPEDLEGRIVLMGDCKDYRDIRTTPFKIKGSYNLPGVINIGYTVNSLLCSRDYCKDNGFSFNRRRYNEPFKTCSTAMNLSMSYIMCFLLSLLVSLFSNRNVTSFTKFKRIWFIVLSFVSVIAAEIIMVILCFAVFTSLFLKIPDILLFLTSLLFVDTCIKLVEVFNNESSAYLDI
ncbi:MAG: CHASE2 domain-containing protein [Bacteroidales bacterium]|nr:CHASE2 domain-containing protein [Bacteroidales bacterium]